MLRLWRVAPRYANKSLVGTWLLSCSNIEFDNDIIVDAGFDHFKFREKCVSQLMYFINKITVRIQAAIRGFIARRYVNRLRKKLRVRRTKKKDMKKKASRKLVPPSPGNSHIYDDDSIATEYSREDLLFGSSLDAASIDTECSHLSYGSGSQQSRSKTLDLKTDPEMLRRRHQRIKETATAYSSTSPLSAPSRIKTRPNPNRSGIGKSKSAKTVHKVKLRDSRLEMESELHTLRNEIGDVLLSFQQELKEVKQTVSYSNYQSSRVQGAVGPNNILNEVSSICEQEMQPVKDMMAQVLSEITSLRSAKTPALLSAQRNTISENFSSDMTKLVAQMAQLQEQMAAQGAVGSAAVAQMKKVESLTEASANHIHESVLKAYKDKIEILEKSEQEKIKRIAVLNMQMRRSSTAVGMKQREQYNELMTTKAELEEANGQVAALQVKLNEAESTVKSLKTEIVHAKNHRTPTEETIGLQKSLDMARAREKELQRAYEEAIKDHNSAMASMSTRLNAAKQEISSLNLELQEVKLVVAAPGRNDECEELRTTVDRLTSQLKVSQLQVGHLQEEVQLTKLEKLRLSDKLAQSKEITPNMGDVEVGLRQTIDELDKKVIYNSS